MSRLDMADIQLPVNQETERGQVDNDRCRYQPIPQTGPRKAFRAAVIFGHGLQRDAPPKVSVNLDVPFVPAGVGGITPAFLIEQAEDRAEQVMAVLALLAPITATAQAPAEFRAGRQLFVRF